jgi:hypothetical protein
MIDEKEPLIDLAKIIKTVVEQWIIVCNDNKKKENLLAQRK